MGTTKIKILVFKKILIVSLYDSCLKPNRIVKTPKLDWFFISLVLYSIFLTYYYYAIQSASFCLLSFQTLTEFQNWLNIIEAHVL